MARMTPTVTCSYEDYQELRDLKADTEDRMRAWKLQILTHLSRTVKYNSREELTRYVDHLIQELGP